MLSERRRRCKRRMFHSEWPQNKKWNYVRKSLAGNWIAAIRRKSSFSLLDRDSCQLVRILMLLCQLLSFDRSQRSHSLSRADPSTSPGIRYIKIMSNSSTPDDFPHQLFSACATSTSWWRPEWTDQATIVFTIIHILMLGHFNGPNVRINYNKLCILCLCFINKCHAMDRIRQQRRWWCIRW